MDGNAADEGVVEIPREVRRERDDAVESVELLEHDGAGDVDGLVGGLRHGSHALPQNAVRFVEKEQRVLFLRGLEGRNDVLPGFADVLRLDFGIAHVDEFLSPSTGERFDAHGLSRSGRPVEVEGDVLPAWVDFAQPPLAVHEVVEAETALERFEPQGRRRVEDEVLERRQRFAGGEYHGLLLLPRLRGLAFRCRKRRRSQRSLGIQRLFWWQEDVFPSSHVPLSFAS